MGPTLVGRAGIARRRVQATLCGVPIDLSNLGNTLWDPIKTPTALAAGALLTQLWRRFLNRLAVFRWSVWHSPLATAGTDPTIGKVDVLWNDTPVHNLQFCNIEFENESGRDFTEVLVKFWYTDGTSILGQGSLQGTAQFFPYAPHFKERVETLLAMPPADQDRSARQFARP